MNSLPRVSLEERLRLAGRALRYPRTPAISAAVRRRVGATRRGGISLRVRIAAVILALLAAAWAVPDVRARIIEFIQIGVIRIFPAEPTSTPGSSGAVPPVQVPLTATSIDEPRPQPPSVVSIAGLAGETTLDEARTQVPFEIRLPTYPPGLGTPDRVFVQDDGPTVILVWLDEVNPDTVRISLHQIGPRGFYLDKYEPRVLEETEVNGEPAIWAEGPYLVRLSVGREDFRRLVDGNTLVWKSGGITFRLESTLTLPEAVEIAESLE